MISVDEALTLIREHVEPTEAQQVTLNSAIGRTLALDVTAEVTHPPSRVSAMDGYAVAWRPDLSPGTTFQVVGESAAGRPFLGLVGNGAVRISTGGVVPDDANHIIIQEDTELQDAVLILNSHQPVARNIRPKGEDFAGGDVILHRGRVLEAMDTALLAAAGCTNVLVHRVPKLAFLTSGDELVEPGQPLGAGEIYNSNAAGLVPLAEDWGADPLHLGTTKDNEDEIERMLSEAGDADVVVPIGGASVGPFDLVRRVAQKAGFDIVFEKASVKPGKPVWLATRGNQLLLGLPGTPAAAFVCAHLFLRVAIDHLCGRGHDRLLTSVRAISETKLEHNGQREHYIWANAWLAADGRVHCRAIEKQGSALLSPFVDTNALIRRKTDEPAVGSGQLVDIILIKSLA